MRRPRLANVLARLATIQVATSVILRMVACIAIGVAEDRPKPLDLVATDEEKARLQGSMFAYAGTYMADGEKVIHHIDISWNQSWAGTDLVRFYKLDSSTLTITTAPARSAFDGEEGVFILVWEKVQQSS